MIKKRKSTSLLTRKRKKASTRRSTKKPARRKTGVNTLLSVQGWKDLINKM
jgi:hypothetical protein